MARPISASAAWAGSRGTGVASTTCICPSCATKRPLRGRQVCVKSASYQRWHGQPRRRLAVEGRRAWQSLCGWAVSVSDQLAHYLVRRLPARLSNPFAAPCVLPLHADEDPQRRTRITFVPLDILRRGGRKHGVEVARLRIFGCPRGNTHDCLSRRLRSTSVELQAVTISQVPLRDLLYKRRAAPGRRGDRRRRRRLRPLARGDLLPHDPNLFAEIR